MRNALTSADDMARYFSGQHLYGDDFNEVEILAWFRDEEEGYANLGAKEKSSYTYAYHTMNVFHGFKHLPDRKFSQALGIGSAYGEEFRPIASRLDHITILDASSTFTVSDVNGVPVTYTKAQMSGDLPFSDGVFDLMTCFGVLHHIPNVSHVLCEMCRCLATGGHALIREPIVSMGDWRFPRPGLTKHERGIPHALLATMIHQAGFQIERVAPCVFPLVPRLWEQCGGLAFNSTIATVLDSILARAFSWNIQYHRNSFLSKFAPAASFWVLRK